MLVLNGFVRHGGGFLSMSKKRFDCKWDYSNCFIQDTEDSVEVELNDDYDIAVKGGMSSGGVVFSLDILNQIYKRVGWDLECLED